MVRVKCPAQEHNTVSPAWARTWTACSGEECTNHEATTHILVLLDRQCIFGQGKLVMVFVMKQLAYNYAKNYNAFYNAILPNFTYSVSGIWILEKSCLLQALSNMNNLILACC